RYHDAVRAALIKDGWTITHDPLRLPWGEDALFIDLGAEQLLAADKGEQRIAVEEKSFIGVSPVTDLERALGQVVLFQSILADDDPGRELWLAAPREVVGELFAQGKGGRLLRKRLVRVCVFDPDSEEVLQWLT